MEDKNTLSVEEKLRSLYKLQLIDSKIESIKNLQGELPLEVKDLEDELKGLESKVDSNKENIEAIENDIKSKELFIAECNGLLKKYIEQQKNVRNSREYDSLSKETEYQELEIQLAEKQVKELEEDLKNEKENLKIARKDFREKKDNLKIKKEELKEISSETEKEEKRLTAKMYEFREHVSGDILVIYDNIKNRVKNKLAVVPIEHNTAKGVYFVIPPQIQLDVTSRNKIIYDEYSGRILIDSALAEEVATEIENILLN